MNHIINAQRPNDFKTVTKNGMKVTWKHVNDQIYFTMTAPTNGWVTIGFNNSSSTTGSYLLMGNVIKGQPQLVEHYTIAPGNYKPLKDLGASVSVTAINALETKGKTSIQFSLPIKSNNKHARNLEKGSEYVMLMAYSLDDDFRHHSIMRTSVKVKL